MVSWNAVGDDWGCPTPLLGPERGFMVPMGGMGVAGASGAFLGAPREDRTGEDLPAQC